MIDISLFGTTTVRSRQGTAAGVPVDLSGVKPRRILQILAAELGSPVTKDVLAERLWDGRPPASYVASVESYVCVLRRSLPASPGETPLVTTHGAYLLDPRFVRVDLVEIRAALGALQDCTGEPLVTGAEWVVDQLRGGLLADEPFAEWAEDIRHRFDDLLDIVLTTAADAATIAGQGTRGVRLARAALDHSPLSEPACKALMSAYRALGGRAQALRAYADLRTVMCEELGVEPSVSTHALYLAILEESEGAHLRERDRHELGTLVRLLRQALESGVRPDPLTRSMLAEVGQAALRQSA